MAKDVYRIVLPDGQEFAWHGTLEALPEAHPGAQITGHLVMDAAGQGTWEPYQEPARSAPAKRGRGRATDTAGEVTSGETSTADTAGEVTSP